MSLLLGAGLLWLAVPRTFAAWAGLEAGTALHEVSWGKTPEPDDVAAGIAGLARAIEWVPSAKRFTDLATLEFERAKSLPVDDPRREEALESAESRFVDGLSLNPVDGPSWLRLAWVRDMLRRPARSIAVCLVQSLDMAPNMRPLWLPRARMLLAYWPAMTEDEVATVHRQIRTIWSVDPAMRRPLVQTALEVKQLPALYRALGDDAERQAELIKLLMALPK